ncbi:MAG: hypothetical protein A3E78_02885 [Alphaproteobacteria bacterium RIFCSPHIGHO2_12_FULL_63_12]|nr:MAG: hypothetical protein A3E78_02885 [Alphaproteobacteria bacterium RIFCSPHIGHO2_12_FULL_63_12]
MTNAAISPITIAQGSARPEWNSARLAFGLLVGAFALAFHGSAVTMSMIWLSSSVYHHGMFVAPISAWLILRRKDWRVAAPVADYLGVAVLAAAAVAQLIAQASGVDLIGHASLVIAIIGAVITAFGRALAARWAFPLAFLFFMVPFGEEATPILQGWASSAIAAALNFSGVETARDGFMLTTSAGRFEVAASCAGLRFLLASAMISLLIAHLAFTDWRKRAACVAFALTAAIFANWLRAYLIVLAATITDRRIGVGPEHVILGWIFYSALIVGLIALARRHADRNFSPAHAAQAATPRQAAKAATPLGLMLIAAAALFSGAALSTNSARAEFTAPLGLHAEGFINTGASALWQAYAPNADEISTNKYLSEEAVVIASIARFTHDRKGAEIGGIDTRAADGDQWRRVSVSSTRMSVNGVARHVRVERLEDPAGRKIDVVALAYLGGKTYASSAALKFAIGARKLAGRTTEGGVIFVAAEESENVDAEDSLRQFLAGMELIDASRSSTPDQD